MSNVYINDVFSRPRRARPRLRPHTISKYPGHQVSNAGSGGGGAGAGPGGGGGGKKEVREVRAPPMVAMEPRGTTSESVDLEAGSHRGAPPAAAKVGGGRPVVQEVAVVREISGGSGGGGGERYGESKGGEDREGRGASWAGAASEEARGGYFVEQPRPDSVSPDRPEDPGLKPKKLKPLPPLGKGRSETGAQSLRSDAGSSMEPPQVEVSVRAESSDLYDASTLPGVVNG
ncbi:hypothetical protein T484DRAFT_3096200 [Baffinella frigidus]|nr:hypothetical protein T484DRAFT_3096200 [Cryptophyta sp. CCMP2293]